MNEITRPISSTVILRRRLYDGSNLWTGQTVTFSIKRQSDGKYWNATTPAWQTGYVANNATEQSSANDYGRGLYTLDISGAAVAADALYWVSVFTSGGIDYVEAGEVFLQSVAASSAALVEAAVAGKRDYNYTTGVERVYAADGVTVLATLTPTRVVDVVTLTKT